MWIVVLVTLLFEGHINLTALVPLLPGDAPPPWWVGGRLFWPFAVETRTVFITGDLLNAITPILSIGSGMLFLLAAAALLRWLVPSKWFRWLIVSGVILSIILQVIWLTPWAILPILIDLALLWAVVGKQITVEKLRPLPAEI